IVARWWGIVHRVLTQPHSERRTAAVQRGSQHVDAQDVGARAVVDAPRLDLKACHAACPRPVVPSQESKGDSMSSSHLSLTRGPSPRRNFALLGIAVFVVSAVAITSARADNRSRVWITSWAASPQGPYPSGAAVAQPDLSFAFPTGSANDQTFRQIVRPDLWSSQMRLRFTNLVGNRPVTFDGAYVGLQKTGATIQDGTNRPITFNHGASLTLQPGQTQWSDA